MQNGVAAVFKRTDKPKVPLPLKLNPLSECQLQQMNDHVQKTVGDEASTSGMGKKHHHYNSIHLRK